VDELLLATRAAEERHFWFRGFRRFVGPLVDAGLAGRPAARVLDAGCGTGANLRRLGARTRAVGIDLNRIGLDLARRAGARPVARATVTALPFADGTFDLVTSFDVLYALSDEDEPRAVAEMFRVLRPGGALVVNVAAMPILRGSHSVLSHEVRRYTRARLRRLLECAGFAVEDVRYTNATLFPLLLVVRTVQRVAGLADEQDATTEITVPPAPVNTLLSAVLGFEAILLRPFRLPFGSSLACLARKPA
jgi:SAM-dependent methyltransferase